MYKFIMPHAILNKINVHTLSPQTSVNIWYCSIPQIIESIVCKGRYHNFQPMVNEIFQKDDFIKPFFSLDEINKINGFKALKKQIEWISGRFLIKHMVQHVFAPKTPVENITISYLEEGAPYIAQFPDIPLSLSHAHDFTIAAFCTNPVKTIGIDIEKISGKPDNAFLNTAFTQNEIKHLQTDPESIFKNWTIKEAYLKYIKKGFNESLHTVEVINNDVYHYGEKTHVDVYSTRINNNYIVSLVSD